MNIGPFFSPLGKGRSGGQEGEVGILSHGLKRKYQGNISVLSALVLLCRLYTAQL